MKQDYVNQLNYAANQQKIIKKGCGCNGPKKPTPVIMPMPPQQGR